MEVPYLCAARGGDILNNMKHHVRCLSVADIFIVQLEVTTVLQLFDLCQCTFRSQKRYNDIVRFVIIE